MDWSVWWALQDPTGARGQRNASSSIKPARTQVVSACVSEATSSALRMTDHSVWWPIPGEGRPSRAAQ